MSWISLSIFKHIQIIGVSIYRNDPFDDWVPAIKTAKKRREAAIAANSKKSGMVKQYAGTATDGTAPGAKDKIKNWVEWRWRDSDIMR